MSNESTIERQILDYLTLSPRAGDTLRGIVEWWLLRQRIVEATADVEAAVSKLLAQGEVTAWTGADGQVHYCSAIKGDCSIEVKGV